MALIPIPLVNASSMEMGLLRGEGTLELFGGANVVIGSTKALWFLNIELTPQYLQDIATTRAWRAALVQLNKLSNTFQVVPPDWPGNGAGYTGAAPSVKGAGQLGLLLSCDGVTINTLIAVAGDYIQVGLEFKLLVANALSDGLGAVTFTFEPALRAAPLDNSSVDVVNPKLTLNLVSPVASWNVQKPITYGISIRAIESFPAV